MTNTAYSIPSASSTPGMAAPAEQNGWQSVYTYAQQLYDAGYTQQAEQYHAYAQQLYDAELQQNQQTAAQNDIATAATVPQMSATQPSATASRSNGASTANGQTPSWQVLYEYAQQLHAAGQTTEAQKYWQQAQTLYNQASSQNGVDARTSLAPRSAYQSTSSAGAAVSYAPSTPSSPPANARSSYTASTSTSSWPSTTPSPAPAASTSSWPSTSTAPSSTAGMITDYTTDDYSLNRSSKYGITADITQLVKPPKKRWTKRQIKWLVAAVAVGLLAVVIGGYMGLFHLYKQQQNQQANGTYYYDSFWGKIQSYTVKPMISALKPAFDKNIRLSAAAQPLLYELNLSNTPPQNNAGTQQAGIAIPETVNSINANPTESTTADAPVPIEAETAEADQDAAKTNENAAEETEDEATDVNLDESESETKSSESSDAASTTRDNTGVQSAVEENATSPEASSIGSVSTASQTSKSVRRIKKASKRRSSKQTAHKTTTVSKKKNDSKKNKKRPQLSSDPLAGMNLNNL